MAKLETFKISKKGYDAVQVSRELPENQSDPAWAEIVSNVDEDIHSLALQAWIVRCQAAGRGEIERGPEAVQAAVDRYKFGARMGGFQRPKVEKAMTKKLKFTDEQIAALKAAGVVFEV